MIAPTCQHERKTSKGKDRKGQQRWKCKDCGVCFTDYHPKPLGDMRVNLDKAKLALRMLTEGMSIRATERTTGHWPQHALQAGCAVRHSLPSLHG